MAELKPVTTLMACSGSICVRVPMSKNLRPICVYLHSSCARLKMLLRKDSLSLASSEGRAGDSVSS